MRSLFVDDSLTMGRDTDTITTEAASEIRNAVEGRHVCPFCGAVREQPDGLCPRCTMESTAATRQATKSRIGPWYVLQTRNPAAPGMKFETLLSFVHKGRVKARSIVRGPTTHQLWRFAAHVKGLSREFGVCYSCGESVSPKANVCPHCNRAQDPPTNPDLFLETENEARSVQPQPVFREVGATPLVAEDIVVPSLSQSAPAAKSPAAHAGDVGKKPDGFLTAADLAAAFKLDFQEPKGRKHKKAPVAPIAMTGGSLPHNPPRRRKRWGVKLVLFILLLAALGAGAFQYQRDVMFRNQVNHWYAVSLTWSKEKWADLQKSMAAKPAAPAQHKLATVQIEPMPPAAQTSSTAVPQTSQPTSHEKPAPTSTANGSPWDQLYHQGQDANSQVGNSAKPAKIDEPATPDSSHADAPAPQPQRAGNIDDVWKLYRGAMDAESQSDYTSAIAKYEQIQQFPKDLWPRDLQLRLAQARKLAGR